MSAHRVLRLKEVLDKVGVSRATAYRLMKDAHFPVPITLGGNSVGWIEAEVDAWIEARMAARQPVGSNAASASLSI